MKIGASQGRKRADSERKRGALAARQGQTHVAHRGVSGAQRRTPPQEPLCSFITHNKYLYGFNKNLNDI